MFLTSQKGTVPLEITKKDKKIVGKLWRKKCNSFQIAWFWKLETWKYSLSVFPSYHSESYIHLWWFCFSNPFCGFGPKFGGGGDETLWPAGPGDGGWLCGSWGAASRSFAAINYWLLLSRHPTLDPGFFNILHLNTLWCCHNILFPESTWRLALPFHIPKFCNKRKAFHPNILRVVQGCIRLDTLLDQKVKGKTGGPEVHNSVLGILRPGRHHCLGRRCTCNYAAGFLAPLNFPINGIF